ncbi:MAG: hypothetical protein FWE24_01880 [Defluviitaleaceae bacterium]|nr:hypothetical protein [Defluviitaleaceae bacterium]
MLINTNIAMSALGSSGKQPVNKPNSEFLWDDEGEKSLSEALAAAIESYKERMLKGLNALTEEEIEEIIEEFKLKHKPVNGTQEELDEFANKLMRFVHSLRERVKIEANEMLITSSATSKTESKNDSLESLMRSMITNPQWQFSHKSNQNKEAPEKLAMRYEKMLLESIPDEKRSANP